MELSAIALQKLLQLFPELANYIVSFKDITEEAGKEDLGMQVGVFILQMGEGYYYIPVIARSDTVMPMDSMFEVASGTFVPLTRAWVDKLVAQSRVFLGKAGKIPATATKNPSVYDLVVPPRTGKYVQASSSRLSDFLTILPTMVKKAVLEKVSQDKETYDTLHRLFGLENIVAALKSETQGPTLVPVDKPGVEVITEAKAGTNLADSEVSDILNKGYTIRGEHKVERIAFLANDAMKLGPLAVIGGADLGNDFDIVMKDGTTRSAYLPKRARCAPQFPALFRPLDTYSANRTGSPVFAIFGNGDYCVSYNLVSRGQPDSGKNTIVSLSKNVPFITPQEVTNYDRFAVFTPDMELIGAYSGNSVSKSNLGVTIQARSLIPIAHEPTVSGYPTSGSVTINAYRNVQNADAQNPDNIFIPINALVIKLGKNLEDSTEVNVNSALARLELSTLTAMGSAIDIGYDGVEFLVNSKPIGPEVKIIEYLVGDEGIAPDRAESFVKAAKFNHRVKVYLSKKADFEPGEIPQFGDTPPPDESTFGPGAQKRFAQSMQMASQTQDPQAVESTIISELLQATDMKGLVREYLPEISVAIDRLGRTLFLARLNLDRLAESQNANEIMSFIANLRNVYRLLGDNAVKLENMVSGPEQEKQEAKEAK